MLIKLSSSQGCRALGTSKFVDNCTSRCEPAEVRYSNLGTGNPAFDQRIGLQRETGL
jgi:hypothetical protein